MIDRLTLRNPLALLLLVLALVGCASQRFDDVVPTQSQAATTAASPLATATAGSSPVEETIVPTRFPATKYADLEIVSLLPQDAIPAIDNPVFLNAAEADEYYDADELVIGVVFDGDARAYSVPFLSGHEIVNDTVGGRKIAITW